MQRILSSSKIFSIITESIIISKTLAHTKSLFKLTVFSCIFQKIKKQSFCSELMLTF